MNRESAFTNRLPPGQVWTRRFPVVGEKASNASMAQPENWRLEFWLEQSLIGSFSHADLASMPREKVVCDIHCVTGWSLRDACFEGIRLSTLFRALPGLSSSGIRFVRYVAASDREHDTSTSLSLALKDGWLVDRKDGKPLSPEHGFPWRTLFPSRYFYKSLKWITQIQFLREDRPGYWERNTGYHSQGRPWREERLDAIRFTSSKECEAFRALSDFQDYRKPQTVIVKANLRNWRPVTRNLSGLQLKLCDFSHADLRHVDFSDANLTFGRFYRADLRGARFHRTDLEGSDFTEALLESAVFCDNALSAAKFFTPSKHTRSAQENPHAGMTLSNPQGLLEDQEAYLQSLGVLKDL